MGAGSPELLPTSLTSFAQQAPSSVQAVVERFSRVTDPKEKALMLLQAGRGLAPFPEEGKVAVNRVMGCTAQVGSRAGKGR